MVKILTDKSKAANYKYFPKYKIKDWSPMEKPLSQLTNNSWATDPQGWVDVQCVFVKNS